MQLEFSSDKKVQKIASLLIVALSISSLLSVVSQAEDTTVDPIQKPEWEEGDYWEYSFESTGYNEQLDEINQDGTKNISVVAEEHIRIDGEWINVYNVSYKSVYDMWGYTERWTFELDYEFDGTTEGNLYYDVETLELVSGQYIHEMGGPVDGPFGDIMVDITREVELENKDIVGEEDPEGFYSFPISDSDDWTSQSSIEKYSYTYTEYEDAMGVPDEEWVEEEYTLHHDYDLQSTPVVDGEDGIQIYGEDDWQREGRLREKEDDEDWEDWREIDEEETAIIEDDFYRTVGNSDRIYQEDLFHDTMDYYVEDVTFDLDTFDHENDLYGLETEVETGAKQVEPGGELGYDFTVKNVGSVEDTIGWEFLDDEDIDSIEGPESVTLSPGEEETISIGVTFSEDAEVDRTYEHEIRFYSENDHSVEEILILETEIQGRYGLEVQVVDTDIRSYPGGEATYEFYLNNIGVVEDTIGWEFLDDEDIDSIEGPESVTLPPDENETISIGVTFSEDAEVGKTYEHEIRFYSEDHDTVEEEVLLKTEMREEYGFEVEVLDDDKQIRPGEDIEYQFAINNTGMADDTIEWELLDDEHIDAVKGPESITISSGESETISLELIFSDAVEPDKTYEHEVEFSSDNDGSAYQSVEVRTYVVDGSQPIIARRDPSESSLTLRLGEEIEFSVDIDNPSGEETTVIWRVDGEEWSEGESLTLGHSELEEGVSIDIRAELINEEEKLDTADWEVKVEEYRPSIVSKTPEEDLVEIYPGEEIEFSVETDDPGDGEVLVRWFIGEEERKEGKSLSLNHSELESGQQVETRAELFLQEERLDMVDWEIDVKERSASITSKTPEEDLVEIYPGEEIEFSVEIEDTGGEAVSVVWYLDDERAVEGESLMIAHSELEDVEEISAVLIDDGRDESIGSESWNIEWIDPDLPFIKDDEPSSSNVHIFIGESKEFSVEVGNSENREVNVRWYVNGEEKGTGRDFMLETEYLETGEHDLRVELIDSTDEEILERQSWTVDVREESGPDLIFYLLIATPIAVAALGGFMYQRKKRDVEDDDQGQETHQSERSSKDQDISAVEGSNSPDPTSPGSVTESTSQEEELKRELETLKEQEEDIDTRGVESALEDGNLRMAEALLDTLKDTYKEYRDRLERSEELEQKRVKFAKRLANDEMKRENFDKLKDRIERERSKIDEEIKELEKKIF